MILVTKIEERYFIDVTFLENISIISGMEV